MIIKANKISKRYSNHWIIRNFSFQFEVDNCYAIQGANGSGKSTLLKILSGFLSPTVGQLEYLDHEQSVSRDDIYGYTSMWGPYVSLLQDLSVSEMILYFQKHKGFKDNLHLNEMLELWEVKVSPKQLIKELSSGQVQRLGLLLSLISNSSIVLLDEPTSFLDDSSRDWFFQLLDRYRSQRIVIVASNDRVDFQLADHFINIENYN